MLQALGQLYRGSWRFALACPLLFAIPVVTEAAQHVAEYSQGFYLDIAHAKAAEHSVLRMGFGTAKVLALLVARYWVIRWFEWADPARTGQVSRRSLATFIPLLAWGTALSMVAIWAPAIAPRLAKPLLIANLFSFLLDILLSDWYRNAPLGEQGGPIGSIRIITPALPWSLTFTIASILPPMIVHYAFFFAALKTHGLLQNVALVTDTLFVGYLGAIICGTPWFISEHARARLAAKQSAMQNSDYEAITSASG